MIIDFHIHLSPREKMTESTVGFCDAFWEGRGDWSANLDSAATIDAYIESQGLDLAVGLVGSNNHNDFTLERFGAARRLVLFASIDPNRAEEPGRMVHELADRGYRGLKLYPTYQHFYPNAQALYPIYEACTQRGWPVMLHTGLSVFTGSKIKYGDPLLLDDIAVDFPDLNILLCHGGRGVWYHHAQLMAKLHPNVYIEISGLPPAKLGEYFDDFERIAPKMIFGSDWPGTPGIGKNIEAVRRLDLPKEVTDSILGVTGAKILNLDG